MKDLKFLNKYLVKYKYHLILGTIFIIISNVFAIIPAQIVRYAFDLVKDNILMYQLFEQAELQGKFYTIFAGSIFLYGAIILLMALLRGVFLFLMRQTIIVMSRLIEFDLKNEIYAHYQSLPLSFYRKNNTGDLMSRISEDVSRVRMYIGPAIMYAINLMSLFVMVIPIMFIINPTLSIYSLLPLPLLSISIYYVNDKIDKKSEAIQKSLSNLSTFVQEAFSGIRVLKSFVREKDSAEKFEIESENYREKSLDLNFINAMLMPLIMGLIGVSVILTVYIGGIEVAKGAITTGIIAEFIIYMNMLTWPVTAVGWVTSIIQRAAASQRRINEFMEIKTDIVSEKNLQKHIDGAIEFKEVSFVYPDSGITALKNVSFRVEPDQSLAIIGTTGSGKSTIANLICRLYDRSEGHLLIDGIDIKDYNISNLRAQIGYVPQDVFLFSDTIKNNIGFGSNNISDEAIHQAARDADVYDNITAFPKGFDTRLGERGITLSGGQKQRVSIARAIVRDPSILILDDSLSAVDTKTENNILNSLKRIMKGRTSIIISHRVSSAKLADKIIVLDDGQLVESGTHENLMEHNGIYKDLYEKQLQGEELKD